MILNFVPRALVSPGVLGHHRDRLGIGSSNLVPPAAKLDFVPWADDITGIVGCLSCPDLLSPHVLPIGQLCFGMPKLLSQADAIASLGTIAGFELGELALIGPRLRRQPLDPIGHRDRPMSPGLRASGAPRRLASLLGTLRVSDSQVHVPPDPGGVALGAGLTVMPNQDRLPERDPIGQRARPLVVLDRRLRMPVSALMHPLGPLLIALHPNGFSRHRVRSRCLHLGHHTEPRSLKRCAGLGDPGSIWAARTCSAAHTSSRCYDPSANVMPSPPPRNHRRARSLPVTSRPHWNR